LDDLGIDRRVILKRVTGFVCLELVAAARILESMDRDSDPCEDFYQFACGGWIRQHPVPESQSTWDQFRALREQLLVQLRGDRHHTVLLLFN
jgi:hypothetical protein